MSKSTPILKRFKAAARPELLSIGKINGWQVRRKRGGSPNLLFAGLVIAIVSTLIVYLSLQEQLTGGIAVGAVKG